ncbi:MAG: hypothetical protein ACTS4U_01780 [Candidatus Hodgkinia cicadicola]
MPLRVQINSTNPQTNVNTHSSAVKLTQTSLRLTKVIFIAKSSDRKRNSTTCAPALVNLLRRLGKMFFERESYHFAR